MPTKAHSHTYDIQPSSPMFESPRVRCTICGFSVPLHMLASRVNLDAITARRNATPAVREALEQQSAALRMKML